METKTANDRRQTTVHPPEVVGRGPTPDPSRSGALWVGGTGVALLLAAAAVLTAVRWDDIGQSAKLGGLIAITMGLLALGRRVKDTIPMTGRAIFHLGALLVPFDMAAVAILAGQTWQQTLLLTSLTTVAAWYGIERVEPSFVLRWCARASVVFAAAGVAAVSPVATPLALAVVAVVAMLVRRPVSSATWAAVAGLLPVAALGQWPPRIASAMDDLGFDGTDWWQLLLAGAVATVCAGALTTIERRPEFAWATVGLAVVTATVTLVGFSSAPVTFAVLALLFFGIEALALALPGDELWKPVLSVVAAGAEALALLITSVLFLDAAFFAWGAYSSWTSTAGPAFVLLACAWWLADQRRLSGSDDWLAALVMGSDWAATTVMLPLAALGALLSFGPPAVVGVAVAYGLAYWMSATWRLGGTYGALLLVGIGLLYGASYGHWLQFGLAGIGVAILVLTARLRIRGKDELGSVVAALAAVVAWVVASVDLAHETPGGWMFPTVAIGAWALSWLIEHRPGIRTSHMADHVGRVVAIGVGLMMLFDARAEVSMATFFALATLAGLDHLRTALAEGAAIVPGGVVRASTYAAVAGALLGLAGVPAAALIGLSLSVGGVALTAAGLATVGIALLAPQRLDLPLGTMALTLSTCGLVMAREEPTTLALALLVVGSSAAFVGAAVRDLVVGAAGLVAISIGVALQLSIWDVTWIEPYLILPSIAALTVGYWLHRGGGISSWITFVPPIALMSYVALADRFTGGSAWHSVIAGAVGVLSVIAGGYRHLAGPLITGSVVLALVVGYESLGPAALVPTWGWLALGGVALLGAAVAMERSDTSPLERGHQLRHVIVTEYS